MTLVGFQTTLIDFQATPGRIPDALVGFQVTLVNFHATLVDFQADLVDFQATLTSFQANIVDFQTDVQAMLVGSEASPLEKFHVTYRSEYRSMWQLLYSNTYWLIILNQSVQLSS